MSQSRSLQRTLLTVVTATAAMTLVGVAAAEPAFTSLVPNTSACTTCHTSPPAFNAFGEDVAANLSGGEPDWSALWDLDSDGDGQSNGEELGDPCGDWAPGETPARTTDVSAPGDASDTSSDPNTPACTTGGGGASTGSGGGAMSGGGETSVPGVGGTPGSYGGEGGQGDIGSSDDGGNDGGCSCRTAGGSAPVPGGGSALVGLFALLWIRRRRLAPGVRDGS